MIIDWYPQVRAVHVACAAGSGGLFLLRGLLILSGRGPSLEHLLRPLSYAIDTVLLVAAILLMLLLRRYPGVDAWLTVKLLLVLAYIGMGSLALKRGRTPGVRRTGFVLALGLYACVVAIARTHDPLGPLRLLFPSG